MRVVVHGMGLDHRLELGRRLGVVAAAEQGAPSASRTELFSGACRAASLSGTVASSKSPSSSSSMPRRYSV